MVKLGLIHSHYKRRYTYEKDDTEAVEKMEFINILNIDIKELKAKELDVTYEFDPSLDSSSELDLKSVFCCDFTSY